MTLRIPAAQLHVLHGHASEGYPHEVVGILAGSRDTGRVERVHPLVNERAETHNRYRVSGLLLQRAESGLEDEGLDILGYYHSHPDHPAQYSDYDRDHALPNLSYVICAVRDGQVEDTRSWRLTEDRGAMLEETIHTEETTP